MPRLNEKQLVRLPAQYAKLKTKQDKLKAALLNCDWSTYGAIVMADGDSILMSCMGHHWKAKPRFVLNGEIAVIEYAFCEKMHDDYVLAASLYLDKQGSLYRQSTCEPDDWVFQTDGDGKPDQLMAEILAQASASPVFAPTE